VNPTSINTLTINGVFHNKQMLLERIALGKEKSELLNQLFAFLKFWLNEDEIIELRTSGSTGPPKFIAVQKIQILRSAAMTIQFFNLSSGMKALLCLSPDYIAGRMMVVRAMLAGLDLITTEAEANPLANLHSNIDFAAMVPFQLSKALQETPEKTALIKTIILGGSDLHPQLAEACIKIKTRIFHTYGMTETLSHIALRAVNGNEKTDWFTPLNGIQIDLDDRNCLIINAPSLNEEQLVTNDIAEKDDKGRFRILGRADDIINTAGIKLHPAQIEKKISSFIPGVFVISEMTGMNSGKIPVLVLDQQISIFNLFTLWKSLSGMLLKSEMPRRIIILQKLPLLDSGKINRLAIKEIINGRS
jgi:o-succinylbenzoate---CoA ligase